MFSPRAEAAEPRTLGGEVPVNDIERKRVENKLAAFVEKRRPPVHLRTQVDLGFRFDGRIIELFEIRSRWDNPAEKVEEAVAKARFLKSRDEWLVYWQRADFRWHTSTARSRR